MLISKIDNQLLINVQDVFEWMEIFDSGLVNEIQINLDEDNIDAFFPGWRNYIDKENPFESLKFDELEKIKSIKILLASELKDIQGDDLTDGEGVYEVIKYQYGNGYDEEEDGEPEDMYQVFLMYPGMITFTVKPDLPGF